MRLWVRFGGGAVWPAPGFQGPSTGAGRAGSRRALPAPPPPSPERPVSGERRGVNKKREPFPAPSAASPGRARVAAPPVGPRGGPAGDRRLPRAPGCRPDSLSPAASAGAGRGGGSPPRAPGGVDASFERVSPAAQDRLTRARSPFARNPSPLRPQGSRLSICYYHRDPPRGPLRPPSRAEASPRPPCPPTPPGLPLARRARLGRHAAAPSVFGAGPFGR